MSANPPLISGNAARRTLNAHPTAGQTTAPHKEPWLVSMLKRSGKAYRAQPEWHAINLRDSEVVAALPAELATPDGPTEPGVAVFGARPGPAITLTVAGAARLHADLTALLDALKD